MQAPLLPFDCISSFDPRAGQPSRDNLLPIRICGDVMRMAIWPPKLGTLSKLGKLYKVPSELFSGLKSSLFPQGNVVLVECEKMAAGKASLEFRGEDPTVLCYFCSGFLHDKTLIRWKNQVRCNCFPLWKNYVGNVYKICFHLVVFLYWSTTASLGPRFLKIATCVCYWPIARSMLRTRFQAVFTLFPYRQWKSSSISSRNTVDCVVKI